jgi:hypothetical protein
MRGLKGANRGFGLRTKDTIGLNWITGIAELTLQ